MKMPPEPQKGSMAYTNPSHVREWKKTCRGVIRFHSRTHSLDFYFRVISALADAPASNDQPCPCAST